MVIFYKLSCNSFVSYCMLFLFFSPLVVLQYAVWFVTVLLTFTLAIKEVLWLYCQQGKLLSAVTLTALFKLL